VKTNIVVGTRGSQLALVQTQTVVAKLRTLNPGIKISVKKIVTSGDKDHKTQLDRMDVAVFVKELEEALMDQRIDLAVHSLKDVPTDLPSGLHLLAVTEREDPRDALVARLPLSQLPPGSRIGTGSPRRAIQMARYRPDLVSTSIRGNMGTRVGKVASGEVDGVIVAAAAMSRLNWKSKIIEYMPVENFLPAVGQGAITLESRIEDKDVTALVGPINHLPTWQCVMAERAFLRALGGGCRAPIAGLGTLKQYRVTLDGMAASIDGKKMLRATEHGDASLSEQIGIRLAQKLLKMGASEFIEEVMGS
jgi:hydroxymethylbilane synthase